MQRMITKFFGTEQDKAYRRFVKNAKSMTDSVNEKAREGKVQTQKTIYYDNSNVPYTLLGSYGLQHRDSCLTIAESSKKCKDSIDGAVAKWGHTVYGAKLHLEANLNKLETRAFLELVSSEAKRLTEEQSKVFDAISESTDKAMGLQAAEERKLLPFKRGPGITTTAINMGISMSSLADPSIYRAVQQKSIAESSKAPAPEKPILQNPAPAPLVIKFPQRQNPPGVPQTVPQLAEQAQKEDKPTTLTFSSIVGMEAVKHKLREAIIYPLRNPALAQEYLINLGGGMIFYGPPGCGKTHIAEAAAGEAGVPFHEVKISEVLSKWVGDSERNIAEFFRRTRENRPSVMFFDEFDALGGKRENMGHDVNSRRFVNTLLGELSGAKISNDGILFIAASNYPWLIDSALKREGRFGKHLYIPAPDLESRSALFMWYLKGRPVDKDIDYWKLAEMSSMRSITDIMAVCEEAAKRPWRTAMETGKKKPITMEDLTYALAQTKPTLMEWYESAKAHFSEAPREADIYPELITSINEYERFLRGISHK